MTVDYIDNLTGLYVQNFFMNRLEEELSRANRYGRPLTLLLFQINYNYFYPDVNVRWGMVYSILRQFGGLLRNELRNVDIAGRYGGERIAVVLPETTLEGAKLVAERIRKDVSRTIFRGDTADQEIRVALDGGAATSPIHGTIAEELLESAEQALESAREWGGNVIVVYPHQLYTESGEPLLAGRQSIQAGTHSESSVENVPDAMVEEGREEGSGSGGDHDEALNKWGVPHIVRTVSPEPAYSDLPPEEYLEQLMRDVPDIDVDYSVDFEDDQPTVEASMESGTLPESPQDDSGIPDVNDDVSETEEGNPRFRRRLRMRTAQDPDGNENVVLPQSRVSMGYVFEVAGSDEDQSVEILDYQMETAIEEPLEEHAEDPVVETIGTLETEPDVTGAKVESERDEAQADRPLPTSSSKVSGLDNGEKVEQKPLKFKPSKFFPSIVKKEEILKTFQKRLNKQDSGEV